MGGDVMFGKCDICKKDGKYLSRKYFHYNVNCTCCGGKQHFEFINHCSKCTPKDPKAIRVGMYMESEETKALARRKKNRDEKFVLSNVLSENWNYRNYQHALEELRSAFIRCLSWEEMEVFKGPVEITAIGTKAQIEKVLEVIKAEFHNQVVIPTGVVERRDFNEATIVEDSQHKVFFMQDDTKEFLTFKLKL